MRVVAVDPGTTTSALVIYGLRTGLVYRAETLENEQMLRLLRFDDGVRSCHHFAIEMIASYGMPVGAEVFETCVWVGRFRERWEGLSSYVYRREVKQHICGSMQAKDANVRAGLMDLFGGREKAVGTKANPGPLYGIKGDQWSALGVAVTWAAKHQREVA